MLDAYLPAFVLMVLAAVLGALFSHANRVLGPRRPSRVKSQPYECGLPSEFKRSFRFGVSFYLVGILFIVFDIEVLLLYPVALVVRESVFALCAVVVFMFFLAVAFVYEWRSGALEWRE